MSGTQGWQYRETWSYKEQRALHEHCGCQTRAYQHRRRRSQPYQQYGTRSQRRAIAAAALWGAGAKTSGLAKTAVGSSTAAPVLATAAAMALLGADEKILALATATAGSWTAGGTLAAAVPTALRGADAEASAVATADWKPIVIFRVGSCPADDAMHYKTRGAVTNTGRHLQVSLLCRFHVGRSLVLCKLSY